MCVKLLHMIYFLIPCVTTLIGWLTNVVAVKMLFHPRKPFSFFGLRFQGAIPKRRDALATSLADVFERELVSSQEIAGHIEHLDMEGEVGALLDQRLGAFVGGLKEKMPMVSMFLTDSLSEKLAAGLKEEVIKELPQLKNRISTQLEEKLDIKTLIEDKIQKFSILKLEKIVMRVATRELKAIEILGGVLGFLIGLIQVGLMAWLT